MRAIENWSVELATKGQTRAEVKIQKGIFHSSCYSYDATESYTMKIQGSYILQHKKKNYFNYIWY